MTMSKDSVKQMFGKMEKNEELQKKYAALMQAHQIETEKALADTLVEFGKTAGFTFSKDDLLAARSELADKINENKELTDGDLANVAGGNEQSKKCFALVSLATVGTGCAYFGVLSILNELGKEGSCAGSITLTAECKLNSF